MKTPRKRAVRIGRLDTAGGVITEMAKVYREMRRDELSPETGSRFIFGLNVLRQAIEGADLERRLDDLERKSGTPSSVTAGPWRKRA